MAGTYIPALDGFRCLCILLVVAAHVGNGFKGGFIGVDLFFVLSGYLITNVLLKDYQETGRIGFRSFYWRRVCRLLPALLLLLLLAGALWHITAPRFSFVRAAI